MLKRFYPDFYFDKVENISMEFLKENNIKGLIFDLDNTIIDGDLVLTDKVKIWFQILKENNIKRVLLSNSFKKHKVERFSKELDMEYIYMASKPSRKGFVKAIDLLNIKKENISIVGDQIFTDVWGAKRAGIKSILVKPIGKKEEAIIKVKRLLERPILNIYLKKKKEECK